jgi:hypothetical protein
MCRKRPLNKKIKEGIMPRGKLFIKAGGVLLIGAIILG